LLAVLRNRDVLSRIRICFPSRIRIFAIGSRIRIKELKIVSKLSDYDPCCSSRIRNLIFYSSRIPKSRIQGSKRHRIPGPQHCLLVSFCVCVYVYSALWSFVTFFYSSNFFHLSSVISGKTGN
jgi:hypothetical protein